jgi:DHA2 family multidrug resistance protein
MSLGPDDSGQQMLLPNLVRALGQALIFPPLTMIATAGIPPRDSGSAAALFNMLRNLGGAVGIAVVQTFVTNREKFHSAIITPSVSLLNPVTQARLGSLQTYFMAHGMNDPAAAQQQAIQLVGRLIRQQSNYLAYGDGFALLGAAMVAAACTCFLLRRPPAAAAAPGAH